ncbi:hypothetical protein TNCV_129301 [Trichonephila clavipes]|nr:hypothetical protein TNCV_129301 [Trichonephila clavipes]
MCEGNPTTNTVHESVLSIDRGSRSYLRVGEGGCVFSALPPSELARNLFALGRDGRYNVPSGHSGNSRASNLTSIVGKCSTNDPLSESNSHNLNLFRCRS